MNLPASIAIALGGLFLGSCTTEKAAESMRSQWIGKPADEFFLTNGPPVSQFKLSDGRLLYSWQSGVKRYNLPPTTSTSVQSAAGLTQVRSTTSGGGTASVYCGAQITVETNGIISDIKPSEDTIGEWTLSRCAEIFGDKS